MMPVCKNILLNVHTWIAGVSLAQSKGPSSPWTSRALVSPCPCRCSTTPSLSPYIGESGRKANKKMDTDRLPSVTLANHIHVRSNPLIEYYFHKQTNTQWMDFQFGIPYSGTFSWGAKLGVFRGQTKDAKIKTGINSHAPVYFTCKG